MSYQQQIPLMTKGHGDMLDITEQIATIVTSSGIRTGTVNVFNVGSTAAVGTIEFEPGLQHDLPAILDRLVPPSRTYGHEQAWQDGNGHSHLQATLLGRVHESTVDLSLVTFGWSGENTLDVDFEDYH
jgi:secondary thiamine-phosphate synthase enzyme